MSLLFTTKFSSALAHSKARIFNYFLTFQDERRESRNVLNETNQTRNSLNIASETKPGKKPTKMTVCLQNISQTGTIYPCIFLGRTLWADSISSGLGKILRNSQNVRAYYMLNHAIRCIYYTLRSQSLFRELQIISNNPAKSRGIRPSRLKSDDTPQD